MEKRSSVARRRVLPRLVLLLLAAVGVWLWRYAPGPTERSLVFELGPGHSSISYLEIQIWDSKGKLVKRAEYHFDSAPPEELSQSVPLGTGEYQVRIFIGRAGEPLRSGVQTLRVNSLSSYRLLVGNSAERHPRPGAAL